MSNSCGPGLPRPRPPVQRRRHRALVRPRNISGECGGLSTTPRLAPESRHKVLCCRWLGVSTVTAWRCGPVRVNIGITAAILAATGGPADLGSGQQKTSHVAKQKLVSCSSRTKGIAVYATSFSCTGKASRQFLRFGKCRSKPDVQRLRWS